MRAALRMEALGGARHYLRIRSYLATTSAHGITAMHAIRDALTGHPWLPPPPPDHR